MRLPIAIELGAESHRIIPTILLMLTLFVPSVLVQPLAARRVAGLTWDRTYGSGYLSGAPGELSYVEQTKDGGFIMSSWGFVMKTDANGAPEWQRTYVPEGYSLNGITPVAVTKDGGYLLVGTVTSCCPCPCPQYGWTLKLTSTGNVEWSKLYGETDLHIGAPEDGFLIGLQTSDGGYVVAGMEWGLDNSGWLLRLDHVGNIIWQEKYEGHTVSSVEQTQEGGFIVAGFAIFDGPGWTAKLDNKGHVEWSKTYDFTETSQVLPGQTRLSQRLQHVRQTFDGGFIGIGERTALGGEDVLQYDIPILRMNDRGEILWQRSYSNGVSFGGLHSVEETFDHGFLIASGPSLLKLNHAGNLVWQKSYGGFLEQARGSSDGGIIATGDFHGSAWALRLDARGDADGCQISTPSNATLTKTHSTTSNTPATFVASNAFVRSSDVSISTTAFTTQNQCNIRTKTT